MGFIDNFKGFFDNRVKKAQGYLSGSQFGVVSRLFGREWSDINYLETYSKSLYCYACVSKIAEKVASTDFVLNKIINSKGDTEEVKNHPILDLLYRVNPFFTKSEFLETDVINRKLTGDSYILKVRNNSGQVMELWNIRPDLVTIQAGNESYISYYKIYTKDGKEEKVEIEDLIHIKYPSPLDSLFGMSPLSPAQARIDTEEYASNYQRDFFLNNARPDAVIEMEVDPTSTQRDEMRDGWEKKHKGLGKNSKLGILVGGKYHQVSLSQREMDFIESMKFTRDDILVAFKVPKPIVAVTDDVNRANAETAQEIFLSETIIPEIKKFVEKMNEELIAPDFGDEYFLSFKDPVPIDRETRLAEFSAGIDKWITINEIRQKLNLEPMDGGDSLFRPISAVPLEQAIDYAPDDNFKNLHGKEGLRLKFALRKELYKEIKEVGGVIKKELSKDKKKEVVGHSLFSNKDIRKQYWEYRVKDIDKKGERMRALIINIKNKQRDDFIKRLAKQKPKTKTEIRKTFDTKAENKRFSEAIYPLFVSIFKEAGEDAMGFLRVDKPFTIDKSIKKTKVGSTIHAMLSARAMFFAKSVNSTTLLGLTATLSEGIEDGEGISKLKGRVTNTYTGFDTYRAKLISRTETNAVVNEANIEAYEQSEVVQRKEWVATLDDRVRDEHLAMDGEIVKLHGTFSNGLEYPDEPNCRCVVAPVVNKP